VQKQSAAIIDVLQDVATSVCSTTKAKLETSFSLQHLREEWRNTRKLLLLIEEGLCLETDIGLLQQVIKNCAKTFIQLVITPLQQRIIDELLVTVKSSNNSKDTAAHLLVSKTLTMMRKLNYEDEFRALVAEYNLELAQTPTTKFAKTQMFERDVFPDVPETPVSIGTSATKDVIFEVAMQDGPAAGAGGSAPSDGNPGNAQGK